MSRVTASAARHEIKGVTLSLYIIHFRPVAG
jgi:hypothetical protein